VAEVAGSIYAELMRRIHGTNIYSGFAPTFAEDRQGWNSEHTSFDEIIGGLRPSVVIDVGTWKGASTIYLADLMKKHGLPGAVIGVDTFLGSVEHWDRKSAFSGLIPFRFGMPMLYEQFLSNVVRCGAQDRIVPLAQTARVAGELLHRLGIQAGLIHIDASHDYPYLLGDPDARRFSGRRRLQSGLARRHPRREPVRRGKIRPGPQQQAEMDHPQGTVRREYFDMIALMSWPGVSRPSTPNPMHVNGRPPPPIKPACATPATAP
jgi:hypothetical protein